MPAPFSDLHNPAGRKSDGPIHTGSTARTSGRIRMIHRGPRFIAPARSPHHFAARGDESPHPLGHAQRLHGALTFEDSSAVNAVDGQRLIKALDPTTRPHTLAGGAAAATRSSHLQPRKPSSREQPPARAIPVTSDQPRRPDAPRLVVDGPRTRTGAPEIRRYRTVGSVITGRPYRASANVALCARVHAHRACVTVSRVEVDV